MPTILSALLLLGATVAAAGCLSSAPDAAPEDPEGPAPAGSATPSPTRKPLPEVPARTYRVGVLQLTDALIDTEAGFKKGLEERGLKEGGNLVLIYRHAKGNFSMLPILANEILAEKPDIVFALTTPASRAMLAASEGTNLPVVGAPILNPVPVVAESIERPGGRFTGASPLVDASKQVEVLREALGPGPSKVGIITSGDHDAFIKQFTRAAGPAGFEITTLTVKTPAEVEAAFNELAPGIDALYIPPDNVVTNQAAFLIAESKAAGVPVMMPTEAMVTQGAFISYSADYRQLGAQSARLVVNILNGGDPAVIPIEYPERTRLAVNLVTAKELGVEVPEELLARAATVVR